MMEMDTGMTVLSPTQTTATILCCQCGIEIAPNPSNMCVDCLRCRVDITDGIPKHGNLLQCKNCERYVSPPASWVAAQTESRELLAICLKRLKSSLQRVRLIDASFIWTEPHSKRVKVKLTIQKEVESGTGGTFLEQTFVVEFVVHSHMCPDCHRVEAKDYWNSSVQVRQKTGHKKTFFYLEQVILKHKMHQNTTKIGEKPNGLDFFYSCKQDARKFSDFLMNVLPCRYQTSQKLISHDTHSNTFNYKTSFSVEIPPVCKFDIVCLPKKLSQQLGNLGQILICLRVTNCVHLIDFTTLQIAEIGGGAYWRSPFFAICSPKNLVEFTVMEVEVIHNRQIKSGEGSISSRHLLADCWVVKTCELGMNDDFVHTRTHLGHLLKPGDSVMGLDLKNSNTNNDALELMDDAAVPDVILVRKVFADRQSRRKRRNWKLRHIKDTGSLTSADDNYAQFLEELEEDKEFRKNVDIYADGGPPVESVEDGDFPAVTLQEMLGDLKISDDVEMS